MANTKRAKGFGNTPEKNKYETIFEKVSKATKGEQKTLTWYKDKVRSLAGEYKKEPDKLQKKEKQDSKEETQDENILRKTVRVGHLYFFEYKAKMKYLPYYDQFPLVYVLKIDGDAFYGANLHYLKPKKRVKVIQKLERGLIDMPRGIIHKYINGHCKSLFLDLAISEWQTSILLPVEDFVRTRGSGKVPYDRDLVWEEIEEKESDRVKATRIIKGYGKQSDKDMVT